MNPEENQESCENQLKSQRDCKCEIISNQDELVALIARKEALLLKYEHYNPKPKSLIAFEESSLRELKFLYALKIWLSCKQQRKTSSENHHSETSQLFIDDRDAISTKHYQRNDMSYLLCQYMDIKMEEYDTLPEPLLLSPLKLLAEKADEAESSRSTSEAFLFQK